ncbi:MAG: inositol monophosphatase [Candidatus Liptonbacteria bacterium]|nr:inositol monophosphatase [Candidatus Liptonbacteria bacterium]
MFVYLEAFRRIESEVCKALLAKQRQSKKVGVSVRDFVTDADHLSDDLIRTALAREFPEIPYYSEEMPIESVRLGKCFVVDPIDGTTNFYYGDDGNYWGVSIALIEDDYPLEGVVIRPGTHECWDAVSFERTICYSMSRPVTIDLNRMGVSSETDLQHSRVWIDPAKGDLKLFRAMREKLEECTTLPQTRIVCTISMMQIPMGRIDGYVHPGPMPEDIAAAMLVVEAAGGRVTNLKGKRYRVFSREPMVATNGKIHEPLLELLNQ